MQQGIEKLHKLRDAANLLGLSMGGLRGWVLKRKIEFVKRGKNVMFKESTIREIIERGTVPAAREQ
jgi:predicted site-specific integrase-resolvase